MRVNYTSIVAAIRAAARILPDGGRIVSIGSGIATRTGASGVADHAGTKAALAGFTRGAARDLAPRGITVNLLQTGLVATSLNTAEGSAAPSSSPRCRWAGWAGRRRSRQASCSWPAPVRPT